MHGVGGTAVLEAYERAGLTVPVVVESQFDPDGSFPTVTLPNPEEDGALDAAFETADVVGASLILANDPDADRLGAAVRHRGEWRVLTGDEIGALLGDHLLEHTEGPDRLVACSVVSSSALDRVARHHGAHARRTLTGFKWIIRPVVDEPVLTYVFGYEEALGFAASTHVRDKDGITAAIELSRLAAGLAARGADLVDRLDEMAVRDGLVASQQVSVRYDADPNALHRLMATLRAKPPTSVGDFAVDSCTDWAVSDTPADIFEIDLGPVGRILVRPSGTEPKIKAYLEATMDEIADADALVEARRTLSDRLDAVAEAVRTLLTD